MKIKVKICVGTTCHLMGSQNLIETIKRLKGKLKGDIELKTVSCLSNCKNAPAVEINGEIYAPATPQELIEIIKNKLKED